ncbi:hypothetical protein N8Z13_00485, partial [bacterium]|nr:hypothetical protein [bacterium]
MLMMMSTIVFGQLPIDETQAPGTLPIDCPVNVTTTYTTSLNSTLDCYDEVTLSATVEANGPGNSEPSTLQWQVDTGAGFVDYGDPVVTGTIGAGTEVTITRTFTVVEGTNYQAQILVTHVDIQGGMSQDMDLTAVDITGTDFGPTFVNGDVPLNTDPSNACSVQYQIPAVATAEPGRCSETISVTVNSLGALPGQSITLLPGINVIEYTATNTNGTYIDFYEVTVTDNDPPYLVDAINSPCPVDFTTGALDNGACTAEGSWTNPSLDDNCSIASAVITFAAGTATSVPASINISSNGGGVSTADFSPGTTVATLTVTDDASPANQFTCVWTITAPVDAQAPVVTGVPSADVTLAALSMCTAVFTSTPAITATDNCTATTALTWTLAADNAATVGTASGTGIANLDTALDNITFALGTTQVDLVVTDAQGVSASMESFDVVVTDSTGPVITGTPGTNVSLGTNADGGNDDNCTTKFDPASTPAITAADNCTADAALTWTLAADNSATVGTASGTDIANLDAALDNITFELGTTAVTVVVSDTSTPTANSATTSFNVVVTDDEDPTFSAMVADLPLSTGDNLCTADYAFTTSTFGDNCGVTSAVLSFTEAANGNVPNDVTLENAGNDNVSVSLEIGVYTATITLMDAAGRTATDVWVITVVNSAAATPSASSETICYNTAPTITVNVTTVDGNDYLISNISTSATFTNVTGVNSATGDTPADGDPIETGLLKNLTASLQTVTYEITPYGYGVDGLNNNGVGDDCLGIPFDVVISLEPNANPTTPILAQTICSGENAEIVLNTSNATNTKAFNWSSNSTIGGNGSAVSQSFSVGQANAIDDGALVNNTTQDIDVTYTITPYTFGPNGTDDS